MPPYVNYNRKVIRGDSEKFQVKFTNTRKVNNKEVCTPVDITDWSIRFTVRTEVPDVSVINDNDAVISVLGNIINAQEGIAEIFVPSDKTMKLIPGDYVYDIQFIKPLDEHGHRQVRSLYRAKYTVLPDITRLNYTYDDNYQETYLPNSIPSSYYTFNDDIDDADGGYDIG